MNEEERIKILDRNRKIIQVILDQIGRKCPKTVDIIGIGGSFCNGDYHKNSDLDLLIIRNDDKATELDKCFIYDGVGFDIYTQDWERIEKLQGYETPYVTKMFKLGIVYFRNQEVINRIKKIQAVLKENMQDKDIIDAQINKHFKEALKEYKKFEKATEQKQIFMSYSKIIKNMEAIIFYLNKTYVKQSLRNIPREIKNMEILPEGFVDAYDGITKCKTRPEMQNKALALIGVMQLYLDSNISVEEYLEEDSEIEVKKEELSANGIKGTYEEAFSNWRNKMHYADETDDEYLSFMAMSSAQEFFDEICNKYNIEPLDLIGKYNPYDLKNNTKEFENILGIWKQLYDHLGLTVEEYNGFEELEKIYTKEKPIIKLS